MALTRAVSSIRSRDYQPFDDDDIRSSTGSLGQVKTEHEQLTMIGRLLSTIARLYDERDDARAVARVLAAKLTQASGAAPADNEYWPALDTALAYPDTTKETKS